LTRARPSVAKPVGGPIQDRGATTIFERVGMCGNPGTGKKSVARALGAILKFDLIDIGRYAVKRKLGEWRGDEFFVDTVLLRKKLPNSLRRKVAYGHLLPDVLESGDLDFVAVMRCDPLELKKRLLERVYSPGKVLANVESELIGVSTFSAIERFGTDIVHEYDTTGRAAKEVAAMISRDLSAPSGKRKAIDWTFDYATSAKLKSLLSIGRTESAET
jgi:adenylate kinase